MPEKLRNIVVRMIDFNNTFALNPNDTPETRAITLSKEKPTPDEFWRLRQHYVDMKPWEWVKPLNPGLYGDMYGPVVPWKRLFSSEGLSIDQQEDLLRTISEYYEDSGKDAAHWRNKMLADSQTRLAQEYNRRFVQSYPPREEEKAGFFHFFEKGDQATFCTSLLEVNEFHFRDALAVAGVWNCIDTCNPPAFMRKGFDMEQNPVNPVTFKCAAYTIKSREIHALNQRAIRAGTNQTLELVGLDDDTNLAEVVSRLLGIEMLIPYTIEQAIKHGYNPKKWHNSNGELRFDPNLVYDTGLGTLAGIKPRRTTDTTFFFPARI